MTQSQIKNRFFIAVSFILFWIELSMFFLLHKHVLHLLLCFFITIINKHVPTRLLIIPLFLMSLVSYLDYNIFGWSLIYLMPIMLLSKYLDTRVLVKTIIPYILLASALLLKISISSYLLAIDTSWLYGIQTFAYNVIILYIFTTIYTYIENRYQLIPIKHS